VKSWLKHARPLALATAVVVAFGACDEQLAGGLACPALCPNPPVTLRDTTIFAVDLDTSIAGYPSFGGELRFFIASFGDTLETAAVVRYDSLPKTFTRPNVAGDSLIIVVDTGAHIQLTVVRGDTLAAPTTIEIYDTDLQGAEDADPTIVAGAFTPDRLLGSRTIPADSLRNTVRVPIDPLRLLNKIQSDTPANIMRIGIKVAQAGNPKVSVESSNGGGAPLLVFRPSTDSTVPLISIQPFSRTPAEVFLASDLADHQLVLKSPPSPPLTVFRVGGLPSRRAYLHFTIPPAILDSSNVVRATLILTQRPNAFAPEANDTVSVGQFGVIAGPTVTDLTRALLFLSRLDIRDSVRVVSSDSAVRTFEMIDWVRAWRGTKPEKTPRAMAIATTTEGENARQVDFFSIEAPLAVRPRLRLTYLPRTAGPLP